MYIVLSQKIDTESSYSDELFKVYHYPARYRNQIHEGDIFVYYQGNRYNRDQRYYFGTGVVGETVSEDGINYYAKLEECSRFEELVPIYLPSGGYVEQMGYEQIRKSEIPPWQSSIRPLSEEAYNYIISRAYLDENNKEDVLNEEYIRASLNEAMQRFFKEQDEDAIFEIRDCATVLASIREKDIQEGLSEKENDYKRFLEYCKTTRLQYSYKLVLILAFMSKANKSGLMSIEEAASFLEEYYLSRKDQGKKVEFGNSVLKKKKITKENIFRYVISNPIAALVSSGFFIIEDDRNELRIDSKLWEMITDKEKSEISQVCLKRLEVYYSKK